MRSRRPRVLLGGSAQGFCCGLATWTLCLARHFLSKLQTPRRKAGIQSKRRRVWAQRALFPDTVVGALPTPRVPDAAKGQPCEPPSGGQLSLARCVSSSMCPYFTGARTCTGLRRSSPAPGHSGGNVEPVWTRRFGSEPPVDSLLSFDSTWPGRDWIKVHLLSNLVFTLAACSAVYMTIRQTTKNIKLPV